jgi:hypothetical protein
MHLKKLFLAGMLLSVLISFTLVDLVGASSEMWSKTYGTGMGRSLVETSDGGFAVAGATNSFTVEVNDFWLLKTDANGNVEWNKTYGGAEPERVKALIKTSDGGFALAGDTESFGSGESDFWLVKTDSYGNMEWNQTYGGLGHDCVQSLIQTSDGGYAIGGSFQLDHEDPLSDSDFWLVKTDEFGNMEWNQTYGIAGYDYADVVEADDGGYLLAGGVSQWLYSSKVWLLKTDEQGNREWEKRYGGEEHAGAKSVVKTSDGGYAVAGYLSQDAWLLKIDEHGNMTWNQTYSKSGVAEARSLVETSDGGYALAGKTKSSDQIGVDSWIIKTDANGNEKWSQTYGGTGEQYIYSLIETSDGAFALAGYKSDPYSASPELWLMKTDKYGNIPEFPSWTIIPSVLIATVALLLFKKRLIKSKSGNYL